jgi:cellulose synthase (UDP-forming)
VFVQLDIDHRPRTDYLDRVLGYFNDPNVAWVQAPSVCGNLDNWTARGLAEQDLIFQGPLQMGFYGATGTPLIIGSHTSYRTAAIREIGGSSPLAPRTISTRWCSPPTATPECSFPI